MGHSHKNEYRRINVIHYATLAAMVEGSGAANSGYAVLSIYPNGALRLKGFRRHAEHPLAGKGKNPYGQGRGRSAAWVNRGLWTSRNER